MICTKASSGTESGDISTSTRSAGSRSSGGRAHLDARPRLVRRRGDPHGRAPSGAAERRGVDREALEQLLRHQPRVERLGHLARQRVDLLDGAEPEPSTRASIRARRPGRRGRRSTDARRGWSRRSARARRREARPTAGAWRRHRTRSSPLERRELSRARSSSGVFTFMKTSVRRRGSAPPRPRGSRGRAPRRRSPTILRRPARSFDSIGAETALRVAGVQRLRRPSDIGTTTSAQRGAIDDEPRDLGHQERHVARHREGGVPGRGLEPGVDAAERAVIGKDVGHHGEPEGCVHVGVLVTMRRSSVTARITSTTRSMMRRPPSSINALGWPPMRVLLPPAWMTPVTLIARRS